MTGTDSVWISLAGVTAGWTQDRPVIYLMTVEIPRTGVTAISGSNGSGKSTLLELMSGYLRPWDGEVKVGGLPASSPLVRRARRVCRTTPALFGLMTTRDHLILSARSTGDAIARQIARAEALGLRPWLDENAGTLSSGNAKKLWYVICTAGEFDLVLLDEPFNALDSAAIGVLLSELSSWAHDRCVVIVAHQPPPGLVVDNVIEIENWAVGRA